MEEKIYRPRIYWGRVGMRVALGVGVALIIGIFAGYIAEHFGVKDELKDKLFFVCFLCMWKIGSFEGRVAALVIFLEVLIFIKPLAIWMVKVYQRYAPESLRDECLFEPSCSNYMIMAIEKYGFFKGFWKGIKRLRRCKQPNGGIDYP